MNEIIVYLIDTAKIYVYDSSNTSINSRIRIEQLVCILCSDWRFTFMFKIHIKYKNFLLNHDNIRTFCILVFKFL